MYIRGKTGHNDDDDDLQILMSMSKEFVCEGCKLFLDKNAEVKQDEDKKKTEVIKQKLAKGTKGQDKVDVEDIKKNAVRSKVGGKSMEINELEFKCVLEQDNETSRQWGHKCTGQIFSHYCLTNKKTWNTRVWH